MEKPKKAPERHSEIRDPKLPVIHGESGSRMQQHVCPAPVVQSQNESDHFD